MDLRQQRRSRRPDWGRRRAERVQAAGTLKSLVMTFITQTSIYLKDDAQLVDVTLTVTELLVGAQLDRSAVKWPPTGTFHTFGASLRLRLTE